MVQTKSSLPCQKHKGSYKFINEDLINEIDEYIEEFRDDIAKIIREKSEKEGITYNETKVLQKFPWISEQKMKKFIKELPTVSENN